MMELKHEIKNFSERDRSSEHAQHTIAQLYKISVPGLLLLLDEASLLPKQEQDHFEG